MSSSPVAAAPAGAAAAGDTDGYEITTWYPKDWMDRAALRLQAFGAKHKVAIGYTLIIAMTIGLMIPYVPAMLSGIGIMLTLAAVVPIVVVMLLFWRSDRTSREPLGLIFRTFLLGATFAVVAALVNTQLGWLPGPIKYLFVVGPGEEIVKLFAVYAFVFRHKEFDHPIDGLFYGVAAGAGFAALENIMYVFNAGFSGGIAAAWTTAIVRALISTPGHAIWTGFAGYYLGLAKFQPENGKTLVIKGLMIVAFVHGMFDIVVTYITGVPGLVIGAAMHGGMLYWLVKKARAYYRYHGLHDARPVSLAIPVRAVPPIAGAAGAPIAAAAAGAASIPAGPGAGGGAGLAGVDAPPALGACPHCGAAALAPGARFCGACGKSNECAGCGAPLAPGMRFCGGCGQAVGA